MGQRPSLRTKVTSNMRKGFPSPACRRQARGRLRPLRWRLAVLPGTLLLLTLALPFLGAFVCPSWHGGTAPPGRVARREDEGHSAGQNEGHLAGRASPQLAPPRAGCRAATWLTQNTLSPRTTGGLLLLVLALAVRRVKNWLETPSRPYSADSASNSVRAEYDEWTKEGVLEHYWGEHIHMGSYTELDDQMGYRRNDPLIVAFIRASIGHVMGKYKNFVEAKLDFSKEMLAWSGAVKPKRVLDVGCGIGGTSRFLARCFPDAEVIGITVSPEQVERATDLARQAGLSNVKFQVTNALDMCFADGTFDLVWGCESGEHMPDKKKYVEEMSRVLAPGGHLVIAVWCERDPVPPFTNEERTTLKFVYEEWSHPYFISINSFGRLLQGTGMLEAVETADWTERTLPSWRHSVWVGVWSPWYWMKVAAQRPKAFLGFVRDAYTLERFHRAMKRGLLQYGMMKACKKIEIAA